ncbi:family 20 glycosylhydrolase, partial [Nonlabens tegetincola]|uniref:family 20 glycosylhydrolase n=1 Tax=Nonlabens tegetincola TaxID=323273 RepID=UPI000D4D70EE
MYGFNPIPDELSGEEITHVLGVQGNVWTEYMPTTDQVEYMAFPRMLALSEVAWSPVEKRDYNLFVNNLEVMLPRLDAMDIKYANHLYVIEGNLNEDQEYELSTKTLGKEIRYT